MPKSQNVEAEDCSLLLGRVREYEKELAGVELHREALERAHARLLTAMTLRDAMRLANQNATQKVNDALADARGAASCLRNYIRSVLGSRAEELTRYGVKPVGPRGRRKKSAQGRKKA
ncbi:MAG TPA: hypothetical protein VF756_08145 [Thermoanaerobaculia bacterium]